MLINIAGVFAADIDDNSDTETSVAYDYIKCNMCEEYLPEHLLDEHTRNEHPLPQRRPRPRPAAPVNDNLPNAPRNN